MLTGAHHTVAIWRGISKIFPSRFAEPAGAAKSSCAIYMVNMLLKAAQGLCDCVCIYVCVCVCVYIQKQYCCGTLISPDMFPISSTAERSLFTKPWSTFIHFSPLQPSPLHLPFSLSPTRVSLSACRCVSHYPAHLHCDGERGEMRGGSGEGTQSLGTLFPRACMFFLIAKCFLQHVHVTPAWEALVDKEALGWNMAN